VDDGVYWNKNKFCETLNKTPKMSKRMEKDMKRKIF